jgi:hypothetical protein
VKTGAVSVDEWHAHLRRLASALVKAQEASRAERAGSTVQYLRFRGLEFAALLESIYRALDHMVWAPSPPDRGPFSAATETTKTNAAALRQVAERAASRDFVSVPWDAYDRLLQLAASQITDYEFAVSEHDRALSGLQDYALKVSQISYPDLVLS